MLIHPLNHSPYSVIRSIKRNTFTGKIKIMPSHFISIDGLGKYILYFAVLFSFTNTEAQEDQIHSLALTPYNLDYVSSYKGMDIATNRKLTKTLNVFTLTATSKNMFAKLSEEAIFKVDTNGGIIGIKHESSKNILGTKKKELLSYDTHMGIAKYESKKKKREFALELGHLDGLTYQLKLQSDLIKLARKKDQLTTQKTSSLHYPLITKGRQKVYHFKILGEEVLETLLGKITTLKIKKLYKNDKRETLLWFAPKWNFALVQLWQKEENGDDYRISIEKGTVNGINLK